MLPRLLPMLLATALHSPLLAHAGRQFSAHVELGPELDSNALRASVVEATPEIAQENALQVVRSPLLRGLGSATVRLFDRRNDLRLHYATGAKLFLSEDARGADELVQQALARWAVQTGATTLSLSGAYYESFQRRGAAQTLGLERDFRLGTALVGVALGPFGQRAALFGLELGYQGLAYKPDPNFSFDALVGTLSATLLLAGAAQERSWQLKSQYSAALRRYAGCALLDGSGACALASSEHPLDHNHLARLDLIYSGPALLAAGYGLELNGSSFEGNRYLRHSVSLSFTTPLLWQLYLNAIGVLQLSDYVARLPTQPQTPLAEQEDRSRLNLYLGRTLARDWSIVLRYGLYLAEASFGAAGQPSFIRHTLQLGLRFDYDSLR